MLGVPLLLGLVMLSDGGVNPSQTKLIQYWVKNGICNDYRVGYAALSRLRRSGIVDVTRDRRANRVYVTAQGQVWLKVFEKALKRRIKL